MEGDSGEAESTAPVPGLGAWDGAAGGDDDAESGNPRLKVLLSAIGWGLMIGLAAGALAGTAIAPLAGTVFGAIIGMAIAAPAALAGAIALWLAARPGTTHEAFRRRVRVILITIGAIVVVGATAYLSSPRVDSELFAGPVSIGSGLALLLLVRANRSIGAIVPAPEGSRPASHGAELAAVGLLLALGLGTVGWLGWDRYVGPDARARRSVAGARDTLAHHMGLDDLYAYNLPEGARRVGCGTPAGAHRMRSGFVSYGSGSFEYGDVSDSRRAVEAGRRAIVEDGYVVSHAEFPQGSWVYGVRGDRSVTIRGPGTRSREVNGDDASITIRVADGCIERQPGLPGGGSDIPLRLLGAGHVPARTGWDAECPGGRRAEQITVVKNGWLGLDGDRPRGWTLTTATGRTVRPCAVTHDGDVVLLAVPASDDAVERAEVAVSLDDDGDGEPDDGSPMPLAVDVEPLGAAARAVAAWPDGGDGVESATEGPCPTGTVQTVFVRWNRPLGTVDETRVGTSHRSSRVTIGRDGRAGTVTPTAVRGAGGTPPDAFGATGQLLCLDQPGRPIRVQAEASDQLDPGGPPTAAIDLTIPRP